MIGRSLTIFQLGNNQNEIHSVNSWSFCLGSQDKDFEKKIIKEAKKKKWKPEEIVSDAEVEAIVNAKNCIPGEEGYHKWASDGVCVINRSKDPNLYNPAKERARKKRAEQDERNKALEQLKEYLPELVKLRNAIPVGTIELNLIVPIRLKVGYSISDYLNIDVLDKDGKDITYASWIVLHDHINELPEMSHIVNCPHRKAYDARCKELATLLGLRPGDVENETYWSLRK